MCFHPRLDPLADQLRRLIGIDGHECHEFIAAEPRYDVRLAAALLQHARCVDQRSVACKMSPGVVDGLEVIDVDEDHQDVALHADRQLESLLGESDEGAAIGKTCKLVHQKQGAQILLGALSGRDVLVHRVDLARFVAGDETRGGD